MMYDCSDPIVCDPLEDGCMERQWSQRQYCLDAGQWKQVDCCPEYKGVEESMEYNLEPAPRQYSWGATCSCLGIIFFFVFVAILLIKRGLE